MGRKMTCLALALMWSVVMKAENGEAAAQPAPGDGFAPYQTILDRMPFGPVPAGFDPEAPPRAAGGAGARGLESGSAEAMQAEEEKRMAAAVRVSVLNVTPSGVVAVGFTDSSAQPPAHYYMKVGETRDAWTVKAADPAEQTVVLVKDGIEAELKVGEGTSGGDRAAGKGRPPLAARAAHAPMTLQATKDNAVAPVAGERPMSMRERLRARRQRTARDIQNEEAAAAKAKAAAAQAEEERKAAAEQAAAERAQQREALLQIQEELRRHREAREAEKQQQLAGEQAVQDAGGQEE